MGYLVMWLWNAILPEILGLSSITFLQAHGAGRDQTGDVQKQPRGKCRLQVDCNSGYAGGHGNASFAARQTSLEALSGTGP